MSVSANGVPTDAGGASVAVAAMTSAAGITHGDAAASTGAAAACNTMSHGMLPGTCEGDAGDDGDGVGRQHVCNILC